MEGATTAGAVDGKSWVIDIEQQLNSMCPSKEADLRKQHSIYRVPEFIRGIKEKAYTPQVVAFGPYHHDKEHLQMEEHKNRALLFFLRRGKKPVGSYLKALKKVVQQLMDSYEKLDEKWRDKDRFLKLMMLDGCFLLEILHMEEVGSDYPDNDPIFSYHGAVHNLPYIKRDMLMIENQIPLLALEKLLAVSMGKTKNGGFLLNLILKLYNQAAASGKGNDQIPGLHVLDVLRKNMIGTPCPSLQSSPQAKTGKLIPSAVEIHEAGVHFKTSTSTKLHDINFHGGILSLPEITVDDATESKFLNFIALERLHKDAGAVVTSYIFLMDRIIDTAKDVQILCSKGIIKNALGSNDDVAKLFNEISKDMPLDAECPLKRIHAEVDQYCNKRWNRWKAILRHTYFINPWVTLSVIAAFILLFLDMIQTIHTVISFYMPSNPSNGK